jgi:hypothetical protein
MSDDEKWVWVGFDDDTGHPHIQSFDLDVFIYKSLVLKKTIKLEDVPTAAMSRVRGWPEFEPYWAHLQVGCYLYFLFMA